MTAPRCFYFGCWNEAGHFMHAPKGFRLYDLEHAGVALVEVARP